MGTTDSNGIWFWDENDIFAPVHTALNLGQSNLSAVIQGVRDGLIHYVANEAERTALVATYHPTTTRPLYVFRDNAPAGTELEFTQNGTTWVTVGSTPPKSRLLIANSDRSISNNVWQYIAPMRDPLSSTPTATVADGTDYGPFLYRQNASITDPVSGQGLEAKVPGMYRVSCTVRHNTNSRMNIRSVTPIGNTRYYYGFTSTGYWPVAQLDATWMLKPGERLGFQIMQDSGGTTNLEAYTTTLELSFLGSNASV